MMRKILYQALCLSLIATAVQAKCGEQAGDIKNKNCWDCAKDNTSTCTARLSDNGVMNISGKGAMVDGGIAPWSSKMDQIKEVTMSDEITTIGYAAFSKATNLAKVHISEAVTSIGTYAFNGTTSLTSVNIPASVEEINYAAFYYSAADTVTFEKGSQLQTLGDFALSGTNISQIDLPEGLKTIGGVALAGCTNLTSLDIPDSVESIGFRGFSGSPLESIDLPANLKTLYSQAFSGTKLQVLELPNGLTTLGSQAFYGLGSSVPVILPESVTEIAKDSYINSDRKIYTATAEQEQLVRDLTVHDQKVFVYQKNADGIIVSQQGREIYKYADKDKMLDGTDWLERYEYSDDKKYGGLRQEAYAKDGDGEKYLGAKIYRPDGSIVLVDENNKFINKLHAKIYTVEEAMAVTREGNVNRVRLTYK